MNEKQAVKNKKETDTVPRITVRCGRTTYIVGIYSDSKVKDTLDNRIIKWLIRNKIGNRDI